MALQLSVSAADSKVGAAFPKAYAKVIFGRTFATNIVVTVNFYADEQARRDEKAEFDQKHYELSQEDITLLVQTGDHLHAPFYRYLKMLAEFAGAVDV
jgi:hypothetical protein